MVLRRWIKFSRKVFVTNRVAMAWVFSNQQLLFSVIFVSMQGGGGISDRHFVIGPPSLVAFDSSLASDFHTPVLGEAIDETVRDTFRLS